MTKGRCTGRGDDDWDNYYPTHPDSETVKASSDLETAILFAFRRKKTVLTAVGYTKLEFSVFTRGSLLVLVHCFRYRQRGRQDIYWEEKVRGGRRQASEEE